MIVTVAEDLSSVTAVADDGSWMRLAGHNPETMASWQSAEEAEAYALACEGRPYWQPADVEMDPPTPLPDLTMIQFRLGLLAAGLLDDVNAAIGALTEPDKSVAQIEFEFASTVIRDNQFIAILAAALGLPDNQVDDLWRMAAGF